MKKPFMVVIFIGMTTIAFYVSMKMANVLTGKTFDISTLPLFPGVALFFGGLTIIVWHMERMINKQEEVT